MGLQQSVTCIQGQLACKEAVLKECKGLESCDLESYPLLVTCAFFGLNQQCSALLRLESCLLIQFF